MEINSDKLKLLITSKKLKQKRVAELIGIHPKSLSVVLRTGNASQETLIKLAHILNVTVTDLLLTKEGDDIPELYQPDIKTSLISKDFIEAIEVIIERKVQPIQKALESLEGISETAKNLSEILKITEQGRGEKPQKERKKRAG